MTLRIESVAVSEIIIKKFEFQSRAKHDPVVQAEYTLAMAAGAVFPPLLVYEIDGRLFLVDGFHRDGDIVHPKCPVILHEAGLI